MANEVRIRASVKDDASKPFQQISSAWKQFQSEGSKSALAFGVAAGVGAKGVELVGKAAYNAGKAVGDFIGDSIQAASDLNETMSKSEVVFGDQAAAVAKWGESTADAFGLSKQEAVEAAASFGNVFKGLGFATKQSAEMSEKLVQLAGDLASFNNIDPTEALAKLRSGLAGESEPLRSVGVFLTEAAVKAKAMQLGLVDAHGELSEGAKIQARYALILEQTTTAQGDFARTADGLANSQRKVNAELKNAEAELGQKMLPAQLAITKAEIGFFQGLNLVADGLSGKVTPAFIGLAAAQGNLGRISGALHDKIHELDAETLDAAASAGVFTQAEYDREIALRKSAGAVAYMSDHVKDDIRDAATSAVPDLTKIGGGILGIGVKAGKAEDQVAAAMNGIVADIKGARSSLDSAASDAADAIYDPIIAKANLAANDRDRAEQRQIIASKKSTAEQVNDAKGRLAELNKARIGYLAELASYGDKSAKTTLGNMIKTLESSGHLTREQQADLALLKAALDKVDTAAKTAKLDLARLSHQAILTKDDLYIPVVHIPHNTGGVRQFASGGHYSANQPRIVGEKGIELDIPDHSGTIVPAGQWGGGASITFAPTIVIQGVATPAVKEQIRRDLAPLLMDILRQNGVAASR